MGPPAFSLGPRPVKGRPPRRIASINGFSAPARGRGAQGRHFHGVAPGLEGRARYPRPDEILEALLERNVVDEGRELAVQERGFPFSGEVGREPLGTADPCRPRARPRRDRLDVFERGEEQRRRLLAEAWNTGNPVGSIADEREVVGYARGPEPASTEQLRLVDDLAPETIDLNDALAQERLPEVFVRGQDAYLLHVVAPSSRRRGQRVIGLVPIHRPHDEPERTRRLFGAIELLEQLLGHALVGLVPVEPVVADRPDRVVER